MKNVLKSSAFAIALVAGAACANAASSTSDSNGNNAASASANDSSAAKGSDQMQHMSLRKQLEDQLEKAGYTGVKITPSSFFVEAKDKKGDPVAMVIGPDSFAEITNIPMKNNSATAQAPSAGAQQK